MGEDVCVLGLFTLRDYNSTEPNLKPKDHLFCITYLQNGEEYPVELIWKRGRSTFTRTCNTPGLRLPKTMEAIMQWTRLKIAASNILDGKQINLFEI